VSTHRVARVAREGHEGKPRVRSARRYVAARPGSVSTPVISPVPSRMTAQPTTIAAVTASPRNSAPHSRPNKGIRKVTVMAREAPRARRAPPVATAVPIAEPDAGTLTALARGGGRELSAEAAAELRAARGRKDPVARAHALEDFTARYPHHPAADDALLEASDAYAGAERGEAGCTLARRIADDYPAGDVAPDALWRLAGCASRAGTAEAERRLLTRLVTEFPTSAAARRAGERLAVITGRAAVASPAADPSRSGP